MTEVVSHVFTFHKKKNYNNWTQFILDTNEPGPHDEAVTVIGTRTNHVETDLSDTPE